MDAVPNLAPEDVVDEAVLGDAAEALERGRGDDRVEVVPVAANLGAGAGNPGLDSLFQLLWSRRHSPSVASQGRRYTC